MPSNQPMKRKHLLPTSIVCAMDSENERAGPLPNNGMHLMALRAAADAGPVSLRRDPACSLLGHVTTM